MNRPVPKPNTYTAIQKCPLSPHQRVTNIHIFSRTIWKYMQIKMSPPSLKKLGNWCHLTKLIHDEKDWKLVENPIQLKKSRNVYLFVIYPDKVIKTVYTQHMSSPNLFFPTQWFENDQEYVKFLSKQICWWYQPILNHNPSNFSLLI